MEKHPAYGAISITRVSTTHKSLFDSDFDHSNFVSLSISTAKVYDKTGVRTGIMSDEPIITVDMSEAQFGRLLTSLNSGSTPCTIGRISMPPSLKKFVKTGIVPEVETRNIRETQKTKIKEMVEERLKHVQKIEEQLTEWRKNKHRPTMAELDGLISTVSHLHLGSNFAYIQQVLEEHMEITIQEGCTEIDAHANQVLQKLGLDVTHRGEFPRTPYQEKLEDTGPDGDAEIRIDIETIYKPLETGEVIMAGDEVYQDNSTWTTTSCVGSRAPAGRHYRRRLQGK